jgi:hypothetical protein
VLPTSKSPSPPPLGGELRFDDPARAAAAEDFGHPVHRTPEGVLLPASAAAVSRSGVLSDHVLELQVVTGRGERRTCSPHSDPGLFDAVRAGLGQVAAVTRATLRLVPAPRQVRRFQLFSPDLAAMLGDQRLLTREQRFERVQGAVLPAPAGGWTFRLEVVKESSGGPPEDGALLAGLSDDRPRAEPSTLPYLDYLDRLAPWERLLRSEGRWAFPHPWLTTFVGDPVAEPVVAGELARLTPADLGPVGQVVVSPVLRESVRTPLLRLPPGPVCFTFNLLRFPPTDDAVQARRMVAANRAVYERVRDAGGTLYPVSAFPMSRADWRAHFGEAFGRLAEAKREHDPGTCSPPATRSSSRRGQAARRAARAPRDQVSWMTATPASRSATPARRALVRGRLGRRSRPNWSTRSEASCWPATVRPMVAAAPISGRSRNTAVT